MQSQHNLNQDNLALFRRSISESNFIHVRIVKRQISTRDLIGSVACIPTTCSCASDVTLNIQHARFSKFCHLQSESVMSQHSIHFHVTFYQILDLMYLKSIKTYITSLFTFLNNNSISFIHCGTLGELDLMNRAPAAYITDNFTFTLDSSTAISIYFHFTSQRPSVWPGTVAYSLLKSHTPTGMLIRRSEMSRHLGSVCCDRILRAWRARWTEFQRTEAILIEKFEINLPEDITSNTRNKKWKDITVFQWW